MRWLVLLVFVACKSKSNPPAAEAPPKTPLAGDAAAAIAVDAAAMPADAPVLDAGTPIDAGVAVTPSACPTLPDAMGWWVDEVAPACGPHPFVVHTAELHTGNLCSGACPRPCQITVSDGNRTGKISYDDQGRWIGSTPAMGINVDASDTCTYDVAGRASCTRTFAKSKTTIAVKRDDKGRVIELVEKDPVTFKYDDAGRVVSATSSGETSKYAYDKQGRLTREDDPSTGKTTYKYNGTGQVSERRAGGTVITYKYKDGRLVEMTKKEGENTEMSSVQSTAIKIAYDASGRPASISSKYESDEPDVTTFVYDCK